MSANVGIEILKQNREDLTTTRRIVGKAIAHAMLSGEPSRMAMAWHLASALDSNGVEVEYPIRNGLKELGADYEQVWVHPASADPWDTDPWAAAAAAKEAAARQAIDVDALRSALTRHIAGAYISGSDDQVSRARELETALDQAGLNVDDQVDRLVLNEMRLPPSTRGAAGRLDDAPF